MAEQWSKQVYPLGNGRLGCTVFGDPNRERIQFNEDSLWVGNEDHTGGYQPFGDLYIDLGHKEYSNYRLLSDVIVTKTHPNLWTTHPPFQIDCNFGFAAAVNEMLVQSHMGYIHLLPALPKAWSTGSVKGMKVRGGYELDMAWKEGELVRATFKNRSSDTGTCVVRYGKTTGKLVIPRGEAVVIEDL